MATTLNEALGLPADVQVGWQVVEADGVTVVASGPVIELEMAGELAERLGIADDDPEEV